MKQKDKVYLHKLPGCTLMSRSRPTNTAILLDEGQKGVHDYEADSSCPIRTPRKNAGSLNKNRYRVYWECFEEAPWPSSDKRNVYFGD